MIADPTALRPRTGPTPPVAIVDLIFPAAADRNDHPWRRAALAAAVVFAVYGGAGLVTWGARSRRAQDQERAPPRDQDREHIVELMPPLPSPPPAAPSPSLPAPPRARAPVTTRSALRTAGHPPPRLAPVAPAQAAAVITRAPAPSPLDLTADAIVSGGAASFPGGATAATGRSTAPVGGSIDVNAGAHPNAAPRATTIDRRNLTRPVGLADGAASARIWTCPWPAAADAEEINEQTVTIIVSVRPDGTVDDARLLSDPGRGFGGAALGCARQTRFQPALDRAGRPTTAWSPPIRVRFYR